MPLADRLRVASTLGVRAFWSFALVTMLVVALLAATNITSRYGLKTYTESQFARLPWDVSIYQLSDMAGAADLPDALEALPEVRRVENIHFLRTNLPQGATLEIDGEQVRTPWVSLLSATDPQLIPSEIRPTNTARGYEAVLALMGPERHMGEAFRSLQGTSHFEITAGLTSDEQGEHSHGEVRNLPEGMIGVLFHDHYDRVVRLEREELNRWFMDRTGAISFVPSMGLVLASVHDPDRIRQFDELSRGVVTEVEGADIHVAAGGYIPEALHLIRSDRAALISGWDLERSRHNVSVLVGRVQSKVADFGDVYVSSDSLLLLDRMIVVARALGVLSLLIALPLLWMAWVLAANLVGLLMLNERRTMGLMRLRGIPGQVMGQSFLMAIGLGGLLGGLVGIALGTAIPLLIYEGALLPWDVLIEVQNPLVVLLCLLAGVGFALMVSRRLVKYATTISPREAAGRLAVSEASQLNVRFGPLQLLALSIGAYRLIGWITGFSLGGALEIDGIHRVENLLDFAALPLFIYGVSTAIVSRQVWLRRLLQGAIALLGGRLRDFTLNHTAAKPHRVASLLLVTALVAGVSLYPPIAASSFEDKAVRGTRVQLGSEINLTLNAPELIAADLTGGLQEQLNLLQPSLQRISQGARAVDELNGVHYLVEALLPHIYMPGYGFTGIPLYLIDRPQEYVDAVYSEEAVGQGSSFRSAMAELATGKVLVSPAVASFFDLRPGKSMFVGLDLAKQPVVLAVGGIITTLPGMPQKSVEDRDTYLGAQVDYLNHMFSSSAYLVAAAENPGLGQLQVLIPRVSALASVRPGVDPAVARDKLVASLPVRPLDARDLPGEIGKTSRDMFISLALANLRVYLLGGLILAVIGVSAVALANYLEDRRTLGLLRVRGAGPHDLLRFFGSSLLAPTALGLVIGGLVGLVGGFGFSALIWSLRKVLMVVMYLPTHLVVPATTGLIGLTLLVILFGVALAFSLLMYRRTARESLAG
jgi:hypothetical protein